MKTIFIVEYSTGKHSDCGTNTLFATENLKTAFAFILKFNNMLHKWYTYFKQFEDKDGYLIKDIPNLDRYYQIKEINRAYLYKLELR